MGEDDRQLMIRSAYEGRTGLSKFEFMKMNPELQAEILMGLDTRQLTLAKASKLAAESGFQISGESIRRYYKALSIVRRNENMRNTWLRAADVVREMKVDTVLETFLCYMLGLIITAVESGECDIPVKEVLKLIGDFPTALQRLAAPKSEPQDPAAMNAALDETRKKRIREVYGNVV
ncbi:MAG: hypothetical protein AB9866_21610 [Syntrophobacteraceae bacterium]